MKNVYSNLYAMRAIVCVAHERVNTVRRYNRATNLFYKPTIFPTTTARQGNFTVRKDDFTWQSQISLTIGEFHPLFQE